MGITKGKKLMLFVKDDASSTYKSIGFATSHTFQSSVATVDTSHKDLEDNAEGTGKWDNQEIDTYSWTITSEHFFADTANGYTSADILKYYVNGTTLDVKFGITENSTTGVPEAGWAPKDGASPLLSGKVIITSLDISAPNNENATMSITFTGKGAVTVA